MQWSLGLLGDLMWMRLPETRPFIAQLLVSTVETAMSHDWELFLLPGDIVVDALWRPVMLPALDDFPRSHDRLFAQLQVVREAYTTVYPGQDATNEMLEHYVLDNLRAPEYWQIVQRVDPEIELLIDSVFGG